MPRILPRYVLRKALLVLSVLLLLMSLPPAHNSFWRSMGPTASAATFFSVNSTGDGADSNLADGVCNDGSGACTLRAAIQEANTIAGDDTITFDIALNNHPITINSALPDISGNLNFSGNGSSLLTVQRNATAGTPNFRIFTINSGATVTITGLTISNGRAVAMSSPDNSGSGILNSGILTVNLCAVSGNFSTGVGAGILNLNTLIVSNSVISGNIGGGIASNVSSGGTTTVTVNNSVISGNTSGSGIFNNAINANATFTINNSTISGNTTDSVAGGGGIFNGAGSFTSTATLTINNSTISGNNASAGTGGGIYNAAVFGAAATTLRIVNSTITANTSSGNGGGIMHFSTGSGSTAVATIANSTIAANSVGNSDGKGGGIFTSSGASITTCSIRNTIVANNSANDVANGPDLFGDFDSQDYNLFKNTSGATFTGITTHDLTGIDPILASLGNYGGLTKTMIPLPDSPVIDAGDVSNLPADSTDADRDGNTAETLPIDQRGLPRVVNTRFDIGSVETNYSISATSGSGQSAIINTAFTQPLQATVTESGNPRSGISVTFTSPATGASATFSGSPIVSTDLNGVAAIGVAANGTAGGPYSVTAGFTLSTLPTVSFSLTNLKAPTAIAIASSQNPSVFGQNVTFTATVTSSVGTPTGTVQFSDGPDLLGSPVTCVAGIGNRCTAQISTTLLEVGGHTISATYSGDANFLGIVGMFSQTVNLELAINDVTITEGDSGTRTVDFTVTLTAGSSVQVKVDFATANGSATAGSDYQSTSGTLTFSPGQTTLPVSVTINGDVSFEPHETFFVNLSNPVNAIINDAQGVGTISNDDAQGGFISFSQSSYSVGESNGSITITVNRANDISGPATVDYASSDALGTTALPCSTVNGNASSRCDYTTALGTLRFAAGESSKTFTVLISQDSYVEGPEALTLTLSQTTGGALLITPFSATLTITDDASEPSGNPIDVTDNFVRQHYHDFLNREPDAAGLAFWIDQITECQQPGATCDPVVRRINVSAAFFLAIEFQETGYLVERIYKSAYGDADGTSTIGGSHQLKVPIVQFNEFLSDTQQVGKDVIVGTGNWQTQLENNKVAFTQNFVTRTRFVTAYPTTMTAAEFVDALFLKAVVTPTAAERNSIINEFGGAATSADTAARARALRRVAENTVLKQQETNKAFVLMQYFGYLRRDPNAAPDTDHTGYDFWLTKLNDFNGNFINAEMVKAFISSIEYRQRFGP